MDPRLYAGPVSSARKCAFCGGRSMMAPFQCLQEQRVSAKSAATDSVAKDICCQCTCVVQLVMLSDAAGSRCHAFAPDQGMIALASPRGAHAIPQKSGKPCRAAPAVSNVLRYFVSLSHGFHGAQLGMPRDWGAQPFPEGLSHPAPGASERERERERKCNLSIQPALAYEDVSMLESSAKLRMAAKE